MRTFDLRVDALRTAGALPIYARTVYPRHLGNLPPFGMQMHGFCARAKDTAPRLFVLVSDAEGDEVGHVTVRYPESAELAEDTRDFDASDIPGVEPTVLTPPGGIAPAIEKNRS